MIAKCLGSLEPQTSPEDDSSPLYDRWCDVADPAEACYHLQTPCRLDAPLMRNSMCVPHESRHVFMHQPPNLMLGSCLCYTLSLHVD